MIKVEEKPKIFTFWEPKENIPAYIQLCMQTWKKFLPEYEIIIVDYSNIDKYLGKNFYDNILYKDFPLSILSDTIKCALLKIYGGIWFDADTIITSSEVKKYLNISSDFVLIGQHLAFIKATKNSYILNKWSEEIKYRIEFYKNQKYNKNKLKSKIQRFLHPRIFTKMSKWDYLGNSVLIKYLIPAIIFNVLEKLNISFLYKLFKKKNKVFIIDRIKINALPEITGKGHLSQENLMKNYKNFYFENDYSKEVINNTKGIILLHNSWTPEKYKEMNEEEFLNQNNTLSNTLKTILNK